MSNNSFKEDYKYGFKDEESATFKTDKGLNEDIVRAISDKKGEPEWMKEFRLNSYRTFDSKPNPSWGPDLSEINFQDYTYYVKATDNRSSSWEDVPDKIKDTFDKIGIPEAEQKYLAGVTTQYDSEAVYHNMLKEVEDKGIIFTDTDTALREHPELFKKYFSKLVPPTDNKYAALNSAVWSGGSFIYVPKGVKVDKPLQSYFRINTGKMGQFERTLIIVDDDADLHYVEGCTAPIYSEDSLHAAVVEIYVGKNARCRYSTIQNWSDNIINLVTKRAKVDEGGLMEWIDGNIGSKLNMKYPACILAGNGAKGVCISIAVASETQLQDAGAKMIHLAPNTSSTIISKSIAKNGGEVNYRGMVKIAKNAINSRSRVECDTLILDDISRSDTIPLNSVNNNESIIEHEASVTKVSEDQLFYLMSRGIDKKSALKMIVMGFIEPFASELPMEYAVELNQLINLEMENSIG